MWKMKFKSKPKFITAASFRKNNVEQEGGQFPADKCFSCGEFGHWAGSSECPDLSYRKHNRPAYSTRTSSILIGYGHTLAAKRLQIDVYDCMCFFQGNRKESHSVMLNEAPHEVEQDSHTVRG